MNEVSAFMKDYDYCDFLDTEHYLFVNCAGNYHDVSGDRLQFTRKSGRKDYLLMYCTGGREYSREPEGMLELKEGWIRIFKPGEPQYLHYALQNSHVCWMHVTGYGCREILDSCGIYNDKLYYIGKDADIENLFNRIVGEIIHKRIDYEKVCSALVLQCILLVGRRVREHADGLKGKNIDVITDIISHIIDHYNQKMTIELLAGRASMSKFSFIRLFKHFTGYTPMNYIIRLRMQKAKEMLERTNASIKCISAEVGYDNPFYFSRLFKKLEGMSPEKFVRNRV